MLAVGNRFAGDDAVGPLVLDAVRDRLPAGVAARELDGEPARILDAWHGLHAVILVDAASSGARAGSVHRIEVGPLQELPVAAASLAAGSHGAGVAEALGLGRMLGRLPDTVVVVGVEGAHYSPGAGLSPEVVDALPAAAQVVLDEVDRLTAVSA